MKIIEYKTCNGHPYAVFQEKSVFGHLVLSETTYDSTQFYSFPVNETNRAILNKIGGMNYEFLTQPLTEDKDNQTKTTNVMTFSLDGQDFITISLFLDEHNTVLQKRYTTEPRFLGHMYDFFNKEYTFDQLISDNSLNYIDKEPYKSLMEHYEAPHKTKIGVEINSRDIHRGDVLDFTGYLAIKKQRTDHIRITIDEQYGIGESIAYITYIDKNNKPLTWLDIYARDKHMAPDQWLKETKEKLASDRAKTTMNPKRADEIYERELEAINELENDVKKDYMSKAMLRYIIDHLRLVGHTSNKNEQKGYTL